MIDQVDNVMFDFDQLVRVLYKIISGSIVLIKHQLSFFIKHLISPYSSIISRISSIWQFSVS